MKYAVEMGSRTMIHMRSFIKPGLGIPKFIGEGATQTNRHHGERSFFPPQNKEMYLVFQYATFS
jgi:hypothetical protein